MKKKLDTKKLLINKKLKLISIYLDRHVSFMLRACRLKPYSYYFLNERVLSAKIDRYWFDEYHNSLYINRKESHLPRMKVTYNDLLINKPFCTDLYFGLSLDKVYKISKCLLICDTDNYKTITFLGIDDYFRTFICMNGEWEQTSTLIIGPENIYKLIVNSDIKHFIDFELDGANLPCEELMGWLSCSPIPEEFKDFLYEKYELLFNFLM